MITAHLPAIYLASGYDRVGKNCWRRLWIEFSVVGHGVDERRLAEEPAEKMVERLAIEKAQDALRRIGDLPKRPVLGADTVVVIGEEILGKPLDQADALRMLALLSGETHRVISGVAIVNGDTLSSQVSISQVTFSELTLEQALKYWRTWRTC